ncbi:type VI secretion system contractile sheath large subunit [Candidatus Poribacteria bacterium]
MDEQENRIGKMDVSLGQQEATARTEIPLRILVLGDFAPEMPEVTDWSAASRLLNVTPSSLRLVMQQLKPRLTLDVPNRISDKPKELTVELSFSDMKDFRPEGVAQQVKELADLLGIRKLVAQVGERKLTLQEFDEQIQQAGVDPQWLERFHQMLSRREEPERPEIPAAPPKPKPETDSSDTGSILDSLLARVDMEDNQQPDERSAVDNLIGAIVQPKRSGPKPDKSIVGTILDELDQTISRQMNDILHHEGFQQLESAWRGLKLLIDRTDFRENIRIELLSARKDGLRDAVYNQVFTPEYKELTETPLSVMIADYEFNRTPEDMELLGDIAQMAASIQVPFISSVGPVFFGSETSAELADLPMLRSYFKRPEYAKWEALRDNEDSQYIALTVPRFLLRLPYGPDGIKVKGFNFVEEVGSAANHLWGRGALAVATTLVRSFTANGWCTQITGLGGGGAVETLPVWSYRVAGREVRIPLDVSLTQSREKEFVDSGFVLFSSRINDDKAAILGAPTIHRPKIYTTPEETDRARMHATLPYQLFATRMTHYLRRIAQEVSTGLTGEQMQRAITGKLQLILKELCGDVSSDVVMVQVSDSKEQPDYYDVSLRIRPPFQILGRRVDLMLGLQLHR